MGRGTHETSKFAHEDFISSMPDNVVTNILDLLPVQDAVRTSILSRNWRFKWTMLSQLIFDDNFFDYLFETDYENNYGLVISRLFHHLKGAITKFVLYIDKYILDGEVLNHTVLDDEDINHWILFLSQKGIKDLTIIKVGEPQLKLTTHLFACLELKHLELSGCCFDPPLSFRGFPNLLSLELRHVQFESGKFGELFTRCPVLENLSMDYTLSPSKVELVDIMKLANVRILSLFLCNVDNTMITKASSIYELVGFLPKLQVLHLETLRCKFTEGGAKKRLCTTFPCLKTLKLSTTDLGNDSMLSCTLEILKSFPNLETLEIKASERDADPPHTTYSEEVDYNTTGVLQLRSVVFEYFSASHDEVCLIKYLLACSPFLKKISIRLYSCLLSDEKFMFATKLLMLNRASPVAKIDLYQF